MPKPNKFPDSDSSEPTGFPVAVPPASKTAVAPPVPKKPKPRYVRVENKLRQAIVLSLRGENGDAVELRLGPLAASDPVREDRLTDQIRRFATDGKVRLR